MKKEITACKRRFRQMRKFFRQKADKNGRKKDEIEGNAMAQ